MLGGEGAWLSPGGMSVDTAKLWYIPPTTCVMPLRPSTCTGVVRSVVVQSPSCPFSLYPQAQTLGLGKLVPGGGAAVVNDQLLGWSPEVFGSWSSWLPARSQAPLTVTV